MRNSIRRLAVLIGIGAYLGNAVIFATSVDRQLADYLLFGMLTMIAAFMVQEACWVPEDNDSSR